MNGRSRNRRSGSFAASDNGSHYPFYSSLSGVGWRAERCGGRLRAHHTGGARAPRRPRAATRPRRARERAARAARDVCSGVARRTTTSTALALRCEVQGVSTREARYRLHSVGPTRETPGDGIHGAMLGPCALRGIPSHSTVASLTSQPRRPPCGNPDSQTRMDARGD